MSNAGREAWTTGTSPRRGSAAIRLVLAIAGLAIAVLVLQLTRGPGDPVDPLGPARPEAPAPAPGLTEPEPAPGLRPEGRVQATTPVDLRDYTKTYEGTGAIIGTLEMRPPTLPFPPTWELVVEPSAVSVGREHAATRVIEMEGRQTTFEVRDLPLGGYRVTARADGYSGTSHEVLLYLLEEAPNSGQTIKSLVMHMRPAGTLVGSILDHQGMPAEGVPVTVGSTTSSQRWTAATDIVGVWRVPALIDGRYRVWVGPVTRPLVPEFEVTMRGTEVEAPEQKLPATGSVLLSVTDQTGRPLEEVRVLGFGPSPVDVVTGFEGRVLVPHLLPGDYHLRVEPGPTQHTGRVDFTVTAEDDQKLVQIQAGL